MQESKSPNNNSNIDNMAATATTNQPSSRQYLEAYLRASDFLMNHQAQLQSLHFDPSYQVAIQRIALQTSVSPFGSSPSSPQLLNLPGGSPLGADLLAQTARLQSSVAHLPQELHMPRISAVATSPRIPKSTQGSLSIHQAHQGSLSQQLSFPASSLATLASSIKPEGSLNASYYNSTGNSAAAAAVASILDPSLLLRGQRPTDDHALRTALRTLSHPSLPLVDRHVSATSNGSLPRSTPTHLLVRNERIEELVSRTAIGREETFVLDGKVPATVAVSSPRRIRRPGESSSSDDDSSSTARVEETKPSTSKANLLEQQVNKKKKPHLPREYIEKVHMLDVLCGRGGRSNRHPGNQYYRRLVLKMKDKYRIIGCNDAKKDLSMEIVQSIRESGGRFIKLDKATGKFYLLTLSEARKKTSQALREIRSPIWT